MAAAVIAEWMQRRAARRAAEEREAHRKWRRAVELNEAFRCGWCHRDLSEFDLDQGMVSWVTFGGQQHTYLICYRCWDASQPLSI